MPLLVNPISINSVMGLESLCSSPQRQRHRAIPCKIVFVLFNAIVNTVPNEAPSPEPRGLVIACFCVVLLLSQLPSSGEEPHPHTKNCLLSLRQEKIARKDE